MSYRQRWQAPLRNAGADRHFAGRQHICPQPGLVHEGLHHLRRGKIRRRQGLSQAQARFTQFHAPQLNIADHERLADQFVQAYTSGDQIATGDGEVVRAMVFGGETLEFFSLDQCDVLAGLVVPIEVPVTFDPGAGNDPD